MAQPTETATVAASTRRRKSIRWSQETIAIMAVGVPILLAVLGVLWNTFSLDGRIASEVDRITSELETLEAAHGDIRRSIREEHIEIRDAMRLEHAEIREALRDHANR